MTFSEVEVTPKGDLREENVGSWERSSILKRNKSKCATKCEECMGENPSMETKTSDIEGHNRTAVARLCLLEEKCFIAEKTNSAVFEHDVGTEEDGMFYKTTRTSSACNTSISSHCTSASNTEVISSAGIRTEAMVLSLESLILLKPSRIGPEMVVGMGSTERWSYQSTISEHIQAAFNFCVEHTVYGRGLRKV